VKAAWVCDRGASPYRDWRDRSSLIGTCTFRIGYSETGQTEILEVTLYTQGARLRHRRTIPRTELFATSLLITWWVTG
jgi:hypothetical protein